MKYLYLLLLFAVSATEAAYYIENGQRLELSQVFSPETVELRDHKQPYLYQKPNGHLVGIENRLFVELMPEVETESFAVHYQLKLLRRVLPNTYLFQTDANVLDILELIYKDHRVINAYPDFLKKAKKR